MYNEWTTKYAIQDVEKLEGAPQQLKEVAIRQQVEEVVEVEKDL